MGTCNSAESPRKWGSFEYPHPPNRATAAALLERDLMRIKIFFFLSTRLKKKVLLVNVWRCWDVGLPVLWALLCICVYTCGSETIRSYVSVKGSEGSPVTGSVCITARCEQECDVSECSGCLSRPAPLFLLSYCPLSPSHASLSPLPKTPLFAPQTLLSLSISLLSRCSCFTVHFLNLGFCAQFCPSLSSHVFTAFLT